MEDDSPGFVQFPAACRPQPLNLRVGFLHALANGRHFFEAVFNGAKVARVRPGQTVRYPRLRHAAGLAV